MSRLKESTENEIVKRLNVVIHLLLEQRANSDESTTSKIERLLKLGLSTAEVAAIIGKPVNYVTAVTSTKKKRHNQKKIQKMVE